MVNKVTKKKSTTIATTTAANTTATTDKLKKRSGSSSDDDDDNFSDDDDFQDDKPFDEKEFIKLLCDKYPSNYIKTKYNALLDGANSKETTATAANAPTIIEPSMPRVASSTTDLSSIPDIDLGPRRKKRKAAKDASVFITVVAADDADNNDDDSSYHDDSDNDSSSDIDDNISVSSVSSVSSMSDASDISDDDVPTSTTDNAIYSKLKSAYKADPKNRTLKKLAVVCKNEIKQSAKLTEKYEKKQRAHNKRLFKKVIYETEDMDDSKYFKNASIAEQKQLIQQARAINDVLKLNKPYRILIMESELPILHKSHAMKKINILETSDPGTSDYNKNKQWVDNFMRIPFDKYVNLPVTSNSPPADITAFIVNAKKTLDDTVYGMEDAKMQIMQMIGQLVINPTSVGTAIGICGPPGVGKSTLIKDGVSKILGRPFAMITLGGAADGSFLEGHSYTYEGSVWGRLVQILIESKCMNPIIYFGELDKISGTPRGEEIIGILTHLTDTTQNMQFHDKYFSDIAFDFSKAMFIFDYNDETLVNPILRDRLYKIYAKEYTNADKQIIAANYLLPRICNELKFDRTDVVFPKAIITYIIDHFCNNEKGVRNLKRSLETIYRKLNLVRLLVSNTSKEDMAVFGKCLDVGNISFPLTIDTSIINKLLERPATSTAHLMMYA